MLTMPRRTKRWERKAVIGPPAQQYFHDWSMQQGGAQQSPTDWESLGARLVPRPRQQQGGPPETGRPRRPGPYDDDDDDDDHDEDNTLLVQTRLGDPGEASSSTEVVVPADCLAVAMVRRVLRRLVAIFAATTEVHLQGQAEQLLLQLDPLGQPRSHDGGTNSEKWSVNSEDWRGIYQAP